MFYIKLLIATPMIQLIGVGVDVSYNVIHMLFLRSILYSARDM